MIVGIILLRSLYLQTIERPALEIQAERQHNQRLHIQMQRGPIYDSEGNILAVSLPVDSIFSIPSTVEAPERTAEILSKILKPTKENFYKKLTAKVSFTWLQRNVKPAASERIRELKLPGIYYLKEYQRFYPLRDHAAQLVGFSGIDSQGLEGLEYQYSSHLMGDTNRHSAWNYLYAPPKLKTFLGGSLVLTIDNRLQYIAEKEIRSAVQKMEAKDGIAIIMESQTGNILAIANLPNFDLNNFENYSQSTYFNRAVSATYEPGSTFKIITIATALEHKVVEKGDIFFCENGEYQIQDRIIHDTTKHGWLTLKNIIKKSSNICAAKIGQLISKPVFYKMIREFGFGSKTGIKLPGEAAGKVHNYQEWLDTDVATISYGHTISATPIQVITAINTIATGGTLIQPTVIRETRDSSGKKIPQEETRKKRILKEEVAETVKNYMISVTQPGGTGYRARIDGVTVAGKTGTSQKFDQKKREYSSENHIISFIGFLPAEKPELTILVVIDEPQKKNVGSKNAAQVFKKIAENALQVYSAGSKQNFTAQAKNTKTGLFHPLIITEKRLPAGKDRAKKLVQLIKNKTLREVLAIADRENLKIKIIGSGIARKVKKNHLQANHYTVVFN